MRRRGFNTKRGWRRRRDFDWSSIHLRRAPRRSSNARILGVCAGLAEHFDLSVKGVRIGAVILLFFTGFWPLIGIYFLAALLMRPAHSIPPLPEDEAEYEYQREYRKEMARMARERARQEARSETPTGEEGYYDPRRDYTEERKAATESLKRTFDKLNKRLQNLEDSVTAKEFDWERRYEQS